MLLPRVNAIGNHVSLCQDFNFINLLRATVICWFISIFAFKHFILPFIKPSCIYIRENKCKTAANIGYFFNINFLPN
jgi:hypothetical protein